MKKIAVGTLSSLVTLALLYGCGGSGSSTPKQQRSVSLSFRMFSNLTSHIGAVQISARLPEGVQVALDGSGALRSPELRSARGIVFGTYSASTRTVNLGVTDGGFNIGFGEFATLDLAVLPGFTVTKENFTPLNTPFPSFKATGIDLFTMSTISTDNVLSGKITPGVTVTPGF